MPQFHGCTMTKSLDSLKLYYEDLPDYPGIAARVKIIKIKRALKKGGSNGTDSGRKD